METKIYLLNVPLEIDQKNTLFFESATAQENYFLSKVVKTYSNCTYQRKDSFIRVPNVLEDLLNVNYVMYRNPDYSNKWFYAFIKDIEYKNGETSYIYIETDVLQTWHFNYTVKPSFIEREHAKDDTIGKHTFPECLESGEYICDLHETDETLNNLLKDVKYVMGATSHPISGDAKDTPSGSGIYNGIYSGVKYYEYEKASALDTILEIYANSGKTDAITGIFMAPSFLAPTGGTTIKGADGLEINVRTVKESNEPYSYDISKDKNHTTMDGYTPRNKKLYCYPYNYLLVSNNNGGNAIYKYEDFSGNACNFKVKGALTPGCSIRLTPIYYKGAVSNDEESLNLGKFPICNYVADMYTNWLTQNSVNVMGHTVTSDQINIVGNSISSAMQVAAGIGMIASGAGALAGAGMIASGTIGGISGITNAIMQQQQHEMIPSQARGNLNCGDVITSDSKNNFHFYKMCIKEEYSRIIDGYFDMFGYKSNQIKTPNTNHRDRYWYIKTLDVNIDGAMPQNDLQKIKNCYNNGLTFWKDVVNVGVYPTLKEDGSISYANDIAS